MGILIEKQVPTRIAIRKFVGLFFISLLVFFLISACSNHINKSATNSTSREIAVECRLIKHTMGESCIPVYPKRIVVDQFNSGNILALGIKPVAIVGAKEYLDAPYLKNKIQGIETIYSVNGDFSLEKVLLLKPDLIIGVSYNQSIYKHLSHIAPTVLMPWSEISYDWKQNFKNFAKLFRKLETFNQLMKDYKRRVEKLREILINSQNNNEKNKQQLIRASYASIYHGNFTLALDGSFPGIVLKDVGLQPPRSQAPGSLSLPISEEYLPKIDIDVFFVGTTEENNLSKLEKLEQKPLWSEVKAVKQNRVYPVKSSVWWGYNILAAQAVIDDLFKYLVNKS
ncbi:MULTISPECIES: iron-siderophore ABC transporter substrate-binding protein [Nostoc]|uniref:Iron-siderophore ABC transporter substrate-binding protein n=1 Tax=Nostoc punctiforme FACHB-252 TaxID=1357509 RepID=A0ABR8HK93_NOSPU|nr:MULTISPECIES: iron-siderophore ABC transporter substrate-binding protein [Nostoc]MBC1237121.1 iron-siderophore ABC transporter substrate-binding protein [Nostoc sp. 2RC]MBD2615696.1 iron-siderophore ABC transporter substrate-binding protein [Nostoc punctiforme FACHB-252]